MFQEEAQDYGGLRKKFFQLIMQKIKEKYFDNGKHKYVKAVHKLRKAPADIAVKLNSQKLIPN